MLQIGDFVWGSRVQIQVEAKHFPISNFFENSNFEKKTLILMCGMVLWDGDRHLPAPTQICEC